MGGGNERMTPESGVGGMGHNIFCGCDDPWCTDWMLCEDNCFYCDLDPNDPRSHEIVDSNG